MKRHIYYISGMHCQACKITIEDIVIEEITGAKVMIHINNSRMIIETPTDHSYDQLYELLAPKIASRGYTIDTVPPKIENAPVQSKFSRDFYIAIILGILILVGLFLFQYYKIIDFGIGGTVTPWTSFLLGLIASVSSCLAVVGGLILSLSAKSAQYPFAIRRITVFHIARVGGFAVFGGLLGMLGFSLGANSYLMNTFTILAAIIMIWLGIDLLGVFRFRFPSIPTRLFSYFRLNSYGLLASSVLGIGTFFLPCGFTQSMQVAALSSGSFFSGMLIMLFFALGTFPILALLSFGVSRFSHTGWQRVFFPMIGVVVIGLGALSVYTQFVQLQLLPPIPSISDKSIGDNVILKSGVQYVTIRAHNGYTPRMTTIQADIPTKLLVETRETYDCSSSLVVNKADFRETLPASGTTEIDIGALKSGETYQGMCSMGMYGFTVQAK